MSNSNYNIGPYWTVNSQEMGAGLVVVGLILFFPVYPIAHLGWYIGEDIIGNNFAKWGLGALFLIVAYLALIALNEKGFKYAALFVFTQYLLLDMVLTKHMGRDELYMVSIVKGIFSWGLHNT